MKAFIVSGHSSELSEQTGSWRYPSEPLTHLIIPDLGVRITPFRGQLYATTEFEFDSAVTERYGEKRVEIELSNDLLRNITVYLKAKARLEERLAGPTRKLAEYFEVSLNRHQPKQKTVSH